LECWFMLKMITFSTPRHARDKHRKVENNEWRFVLFCLFCFVVQGRA
jgi:hypothetical protein